MNLNLNNIPPKEIIPGYHAKLVHTQTMTLAFWEVEQHAIVPLHQHVHEQIMHVIEGTFEFTVAGRTKIYSTGDIVPIAPNQPHGGKALTPCKLMDVFCPVREEYK